MRRAIFVPLLIILAVVAILGGVGYWVYNSYMFYQTDDAQVSSKIINISAPAAGQLSTLSVKLGDTVTAASPTSTSLSSPINGTILQIQAVQGQSVTPGLMIAQVTDLNSLTVTAYVDETAISNVKVGQDVDVKIDAYSDTTFTGHVQQIIQAAAGQFSLLPNQDPTSSNFTRVGQRIPVIVTLDGNGGKDIVPGMSASVSIHIH